MNHCFMFYHKINDNSDDMIETCIKSFKKHSGLDITIYTDNAKPIYKNVFYKFITKKQVLNRRMTCKLECILDFMQGLFYGDYILVADIDLYFRSYPFPILNFDLGITTRQYHHKHPINGGVVFIRNTPQMRNLIQYSIDQAHNPTWKIYKKYRRADMDWWVDQAFLIACWLEKEKIEKEFNIIIRDLGPKYNYCPAADKIGFKEASEQLRQAYHNPEIKILHLKSKLKRCIYEGWLPDCVTNNPPEDLDWFYEKGI